jgi:hypothetical protein
MQYTTKKKYEITDQDMELIEYYRDLDHGEIHTLLIRDGKPVRLQETMKSIKFGLSKDYSEKILPFH